MEENVITIPVYATMANHLCRSSLHFEEPDSKYCWIVGAQKAPLLRLLNQCPALSHTRKKGYVTVLLKEKMWAYENVFLQSETTVKGLQRAREMLTQIGVDIADLGRAPHLWAGTLPFC